MSPMPPAMVRSRKAMRTTMGSTPSRSARPPATPRTTRLVRLRAKVMASTLGRRDSVGRAGRVRGASCCGARVWLVGRLLIASGPSRGAWPGPCASTWPSTCLDMVSSALCRRHRVGTLMVPQGDQGCSRAIPDGTADGVGERLGRPAPARAGWTATAGRGGVDPMPDETIGPEGPADPAEPSLCAHPAEPASEAERVEPPPAAPAAPSEPGGPGPSAGAGHTGAGTGYPTPGGQYPPGGYPAPPAGAGGYPGQFPR